MKSNIERSSVVVVIPVYQPILTPSERLAIDRAGKVLAEHPVCIMKPEGLDLTELLADYPDFSVESFDDKYFLSVEGYNQLMTRVEFYERFAAYEYLLIYQLDAFVFRDELTYWCQQGYDYLGSPTLHREEFDALPADSNSIYAKALSSNRFVLNGGLSLRRVTAFIRYLKIYNFFYPAWKGNEDMLFSQEATRLIPMKLFMRLPDWETAIRFSFEKSPAATFELTGRKLPFACHAWERYDPLFWKPYIA